MWFVFEVSGISNDIYSAICYEDYVKNLKACHAKINPGSNKDSLASLPKNAQF